MDTVPITILFTVSWYLPLTINNLGWVYKGKNAFLSFMLLFSASWQQSRVGKGCRRDAARKAWPPSSGTLSPVAPTLSPAPGPPHQKPQHTCLAQGQDLNTRYRCPFWTPSQSLCLFFFLNRQSIDTLIPCQSMFSIYDHLFLSILLYSLSRLYCRLISYQGKADTHFTI